MRVIILGAGGYGRLIQDILGYDRNVQLVGFLDSESKLWGQTVNGILVLGGDEMLGSLIREGVEAAIAGLGDNHKRAQLFSKLSGYGFSLINAVHPSAVIGRFVQMGRGVVVMAGAVINVNARIGDNVVVNSGATIDHDDVLEAHSQVWPGANLAGTVTVREYAYVGAGAVVIPGITIGRNSIVGAGSVVIRDVPDNVVAVGVPARVIKTRS